jgi:WD40 repeat protein
VVNEGKLVLLNAETGEYATCLSDGTDWIIYTPDGYFDASNEAANFVYLVRGMEYFGIEQQALLKNRPDIIMRRLGAPEDDRLRYFEALHRKRLEKLGQGARASAELQPPKAEILRWSAEGAELRMDFRLRSEGADLASYLVFVNDVALFPSGGKPLRGRSFEGSETIALTDGENKVELSCRDSNGLESFRQIVRADYRDPGDEKPDLYFIGFGVSRYQDERLTLRYADKDVKDLGKLFAGMGHGFAKIHELVLTDEACTVAAIGKAKSFLDGAKPSDTMILAIAGHGVHDRDEASTYYYLTHEARLEHLAESAAPFELIEDILDGIAPRTKLFLMDTCESGEIDEGGVQDAAKLAAELGSQARAVAASRGLAVVGKAAGPARTWLFDRNRYIFNPLNRRTGAIVFSSSRGGEFSYESDELRNGFFTHQILQALQGKIRGKGGYVGFDELRAFVSGEVSAMSRTLQNPTVDRNNFFLKFSLPQAMLVPRHSGAVSAVRWARDAEVLVSSGEDGHLLVWDADGARPPRALYGRADGLTCFALSPDGATIAAGYRDGRLLLIGTQDGAERARLEGHPVLVASVEFSPDGRRLVSVDESAGGIRVWDIESGRRLLEIQPEGVNAASFRYAAFSPDGASILATSRSPTIKAFRVADGKAVRSFAGPAGQYAGSVSAAFIPGDREVAAAWEDGKVYFWDARMSRRTRSISFKEERLIACLLVSPDGRSLAGIGDGVLGFWDLPTGELRWRLESEAFDVTDAAFSPDGSRILASGTDGGLRMLDIVDGRELRRLDISE